MRWDGQLSTYIHMLGTQEPQRSAQGLAPGAGLGQGPGTRPPTLLLLGVQHINMGPELPISSQVMDCSPPTTCFSFSVLKLTER